MIPQYRNAIRVEMKLVQITYILFIVLGIGFDCLLATLSYTLYTTKTDYGWLVASIICGIESLSIAVLIVVCVVQHFCSEKHVQSPLSKGQTEEDLKVPLPNVSEPKVSAQQESDEDYVQFFNFTKSDQRSGHSEYCSAHEKNIPRSTIVQMEESASSNVFYRDFETLYSKHTSTNKAQVNPQILKNNRNIMLLSQTHATIPDNSGIVPSHSENTKYLNTVPHSKQEHVHATLTKDNAPNVCPITLKSSCQMKSSSEYPQDTVQFARRKETITPTYMDIPHYFYICQGECARHANTVRTSISPIVTDDTYLDIPHYLCICQGEYERHTHIVGTSISPIVTQDTSSTQSDISSTRSEYSRVIHEEDEHYWVPNNSFSSEWNSEDCVFTDLDSTM